MTPQLSHVHCRARIHDECYNGKLRKHWRDDGTYQREDDSIVCDPCYLLAMAHSPSGRGLNAELPETIERIRRNQREQ